jgi:hypothetical protein
MEVVETVLCSCELEATAEAETMRLVGVMELAELLCSTDREIVEDLALEAWCEGGVMSEFEDV